MINRLEAHGSYDETPHHRGRRPRRQRPTRAAPEAPTPETVGDIASVPFFIKRPSSDRWRHRRLLAERLT